DLARLHLAGEVAGDRGDGGFEAVAVDVGQDDVVTGQRADVGDAVSHLPGADDAHFANLHFSSLPAVNPGGKPIARNRPRQVHFAGAEYACAVHHDSYLTRLAS